jgi:predicted TIM-barrel fold metal-dependent hydrolase
VKRPTLGRVIDADAHVIEPPGLWPEYLARRFHDRLPRPSRDELGRFCYRVGDTLMMRTAASLAVAPESGAADAAPRDGGWDARARLLDMDAEGIDAAVLYPTLAFFFPEIPDPELHAALCHAYNDWLADHVGTDPTRLHGVALLPLDDVAASVRELERAVMDLGFRGAFMRPNPYAGRRLHDPAYDPFWDCAQSLRVPIALHEGLSDTLPTLGRERSASPVLQHLMSHPFEQMSACASVLLEGVAERFPRLRFVFLESGSGWLPYWLERMDGHFETWRSQLPAIQHPPSELFRRQCFISADPDDAVAASVVDQLGDELLVWASDYPHTDAVFPGAVEQTLAHLSGLSEGVQRRILCDNAKRLYGLD